MTDACLAASDPLNTSPPAARGDDHPSSTADRPDSHRMHDAKADSIQDIKAPVEDARTAALRAPARVKRATGGTTDVLRALENRHRWLLFAQHCYTCSQPDDACELGKLCTYGKKTLKHVATCKKDDCSYPRCRLLKPLLQHSRRCQSSTCAICVPVWNYIQKDAQQAQQQQQQQQRQQQQQQQQQQQHHQQQQTQAGQQHPAQAPHHQSKQPPAPSQQPGDVGTESGTLTRGGQASASGTSVLAAAAAAAADAQGGCSPPALGSLAGGTGPTTAAGAAAVAGRSQIAAGPARLVKAEGVASNTGGLAAGGARTAGGLSTAAAAAAAAAHPADVDGRLSTTGAAVHPTGAVMGGIVRGDASGLGRLVLSDKVEGRPGSGVSYNVAPGAASAPHRYVGITAPAGIPPYSLSSYNAGISGTLSGPQADASERLKGITITATPPQAISVVNRASVGAATVPGQPQLVHSYPPSTSMGAFFPHLSHHAHAGPAPNSASAIATHWLPLHSLAAMPNGASPNPTAGGGGAGHNCGGNHLASSGTPGSAAGGPQPPPSATVWTTNPGTVRSGPVAVYGFTPDAVHGMRPNGLGGPGVSAPPGAMSAVDRYGNPYTLAGMNSSGGIAGPGGLTMAAAPLLLWPAGHTPTAGAAPVPAGQAHMPAHLAAPYTVAAAPNLARISGGATSLGHPGVGVGAPGSGPPAGGMAGGPSLMSPQQISPHALLYGHPPLGHPSGVPNGGQGGNGHGSDLPSGTALWSYVLR